MAEQTITLNKPLFETGGGAKTGGAPPARRPVPVFAGFWVRFMALAVDILPILVLHSVVANAGGAEYLFALGPWCSVIGFGLVFLLFVYVPSVIMPGQTLGKKMMRLRVVTLDGGHPPRVAFMKRFVVIFALFHIQWIQMLLGGLSPDLLQVPVLGGAFLGLMLSAYLAQISLFLMGPFKRGLHDIWADTYVVRLENPEPIPAIALEGADALTEARAKRAQRMAVLLVPALTFVLTVMAVIQREDHAVSEMRESLRTQLGEIAGTPVSFDAITLIPPNPTQWVLQLRIANTLNLPWDEVQESEEYRALMERLIGALESDYEPTAFGDAPLAELPFGGTAGFVSEHYVVLPGIPNANGSRAAVWNRQRLPLPKGNPLHPGTPLIPFTVSPELSSADASPELTSSPATP
jgi:uncharacterized RDD family membrane protein YckC